MRPEHVWVCNQSKEDLVTCELLCGLQRLVVHAINEGFGQEFNELINEGQLEDLFVDHREHEVHVLFYLPLQEVVLIVKLLLGRLRVLQQHALDEDIDELEVKGGCVESFAPQKHTPTRKNTNVVEHSIFLFNYDLIY